MRLPFSSLFVPVPHRHGNFYATLNEAFNAAKDNDTITLLANATSDELGPAKKLTLDLNGKTLKAVTYIPYAVAGKKPELTVMDSSGNGGKIESVRLNNALGKLIVASGAGIDRLTIFGSDVYVTGGTVGHIEATADVSVKVSGGTVTSIAMEAVHIEVEVTGGTVESVTMGNADLLTLTKTGGTVKNVIITASSYKPTLSGGPFEKLQITSDSALDSIDLTQFAPEGYMFLFADGKLVKVGNIVHSQEGSKHIYTLSGPVKVEEHSHRYDETTHKCSCGEYDVEAKFNDTFYATLAEAVQALQEAEGGTIVLLKDLDTIQMDQLIPETSSYCVPRLDLNGHTVDTLVANRSVIVESNAQGSAEVSSIQISGYGGVRVYSNVTVEDATLSGGYILNQGGTVRKVTIINSSEKTALYGGTFEEIYIQSATKLTQLNLSTFAYGGCLQKDGTAVSAADVLASGEQKDGSYVYSLGGPITVSEDHSCDLTTGRCPCGWTGAVLIGKKVYDSVPYALEALSEGDTITLLQDVTLGGLSITCANFTFDWNGHTWTVNDDLTFEDTAVLTDNSKYGGGGLSGGTVYIEDDVKIIGGKYTKIEDSTGGAFLPAGYVLREDGSKVTRSDVNEQKSFENVTVEKCEDHTYGSDGKCKYCLSTALASVTDSNQKVRYYNSLQEAFNNANNGQTITLLANCEEEVTVSIDGARTLDLGGHTLKSLKSTGTLTLTVQGGSLDSITMELGKTKLLGGPFRKVVLSNVTDPSTIDVAKLTQSWIKFLYTTDYRAVTAGDFKVGTDGCTLTGPVEGHIVHACDDTGKCPCGYQAEAKFNDTFYATLAEAVQALQEAEGGTVVLLKNLDAIQMDQLIPVTTYYVPYLDLNGYTVNTLVANRSIDVGNNAQGSAMISSIQITGNSGVDVSSNVTVENVTLDSGYIFKDGGTVKKVTIIKSSKEPRLYGGPFEEVCIQSDTELTTLDLHDFVASGDYFHYKDSGKPVSAAEVLANKSEEGNWVIYTMKGPVMVQKHAHDFDKDTGLCPCGVQAEAKVDDTVYESFEDALLALKDGSTLTLLKDLQTQSMFYGISVPSCTIDWNGHVIEGYTLVPKDSTTNVIVTDSKGGGGMKGTGSSCIFVPQGCVTIKGGTYNGGTKTPFKIEKSDSLIIADGYVCCDSNDQIVDWKKDGFTNVSTVTVKPHDPHTPDETTGDCICGLTFAASVTEGDKTTYYATLQEAVTAAAKTSGTVKLARDLDKVSISSGTATIDWNGHNVTALTVTGGTLTLTGATGGVTGITEKALDIQGGTVTVQSGSYNNVYVSETANVTVAGGSFYGKDGQKPITAADMSKVQFAVGKAVYDRDYDKEWREYLSFDANGYLTVKDCTEHYATSGDTCYYCATALEASVEADGKSTYYKTFGEALSDAKEKSGSTLRLLRNVENGGTYQFNSGTITIDWNGYTVNDLDLTLYDTDVEDYDVTLKSSKPGGGMIGSKSVLDVYTQPYGDAKGVTIESGRYWFVYVRGGKKLNINGGTFGGRSDQPPIIGSSYTTIPTGYVFYDQNDKVGKGSFAEGSIITLKYHENHTPDENGKCICGLSGAAVLKVTDYWGNFTETPYNDFSALKDAAAANNTDVRLTLWMDVRLDDAETIGSDSYPFTIDWNGKKVVGSGNFTINSAQPITLTDSQSGGGMDVPLTINGKVTLEGGKYKAPINLGETAELTLPLEKAFHDENDKVISQADALAVTTGYVSVADHDHQISGCDCGRGVAAVITANGQDTPYSTLAEAVESIQSGGTVTLMSDGTLESTPNTWAFTLDLGGHTLDTDGHNPNPNYQTTFTLKDSADGGVLKLGADGTGRIELTNFGTMILESGTVAGNIEVSQSNNLTISGGTVTGTVDPYMGNLTITGGTIGTLGQAFSTAKVTLHGGTFGKLDGCDRYMLEEGYALYDKDENVVNIGGENVRNVTIKVHTHDFSKGTCPCGGITSGEGLDLLKPDDYETLQMLGYQVNGEEVQLQSRTWGGKEYLSRYDGETLKNAIVQTYTRSETTNINGEDYPTGMKVYRAVLTENNTLKLQEEKALENLLIYRGVSIRCDGERGIRIITGMTEENKAALTGDGLGGFKLVQYGTVAAWDSQMNGAGSLALGKYGARSGLAYDRDSGMDIVFNTVGGEQRYTNPLVGYTLEQCTKKIAIRPFAVLEIDGTQVTVYGGQVVRTISGVAKQVQANPNSYNRLSDAGKAYVDALAKGGSNG